MIDLSFPLMFADCKWCEEKEKREEAEIVLQVTELLRMMMDSQSIIKGRFFSLIGVIIKELWQVS